MESSKQDIGALLKAASTAPKGAKLEAFNPLENIPTLAVGQEFTEGMVIAGYYEETQVLASPKFVHSNTRNAEGVPTQLRHVLRIGSPTGERLGIWNTGELKVAFEKLIPGALISIKYKGKGVNAKGQQQHFFEMQRGAPVANTLAQ